MIYNVYFTYSLPVVLSFLSKIWNVRSDRWNKSLIVHFPLNCDWWNYCLTVPLVSIIHNLVWSAMSGFITFPHRRCPLLKNGIGRLACEHSLSLHAIAVNSPWNLLWTETESNICSVCQPRGSTISLATGCGLDVQMTKGVRVLSPNRVKVFTPYCPYLLWGSPSLLSCGYRGTFPRDKGTGAWSWELASDYCWGQENVDQWRFLWSVAHICVLLLRIQTESLAYTWCLYYRTHKNKLCGL
jgi:hypothetical protein